MNDITRIDSNKRMSRVVIHNNVVYVAGVTSSDHAQDAAVQTRDVLKTIDELLAKAGTDKSRLLTAQIWLRDIDRDFAAMNGAWEEWVDADNIPTRATCEAHMAAPHVLVEIIVTAGL